MRSNARNTPACPVCHAPVLDTSLGGLCPACLLAPPPPKRLFSPPSPHALAALLPRYEVHRLLGHGAVGVVYHARDLELDREVAIKLLPSPSRDFDASARLRRECAAMAKLNHPHIVSLYHSDTVEPFFYLVMEYQPGGTLAAQLAAKGKLAPAIALSLLRQICQALDYAHRQGIIHRDLKPANILLDEKGDAYLADFGLARLRDDLDFSLTDSDVAVGTPRYMAPEQLTHGAMVDARADLYALGIIAYEMLTGKVPAGAAKPVSATEDVPAWLDAPVFCAIAGDPAQRFASAAAFAAALQPPLPVRSPHALILWTAGAIAAISIPFLTFLRPASAAPALEAVAPALPIPSTVLDVPETYPVTKLLGAIQEELDLDAWVLEAEYTFDEGFGESKGRYEPIEIEGHPILRDGMLHFASLDDDASATVLPDEKPGWDIPPLGVMLEAKMFVNRYLGYGIQNAEVMGVSRAWDQGLVLMQWKWSPFPDLMGDDYNPIPAPGEIGAHFPTGEWLHIRLCRLTSGYRLWVNDQPVFRHDDPEAMDKWASQRWKLEFGEFDGMVDFVRLWKLPHR
ncbi:MAG: serine/threonine-protein kinase [Verrucomicrobiales bacterium]